MKKTKLNKSFDKEFGKYVKKKRIEKGWSQLELASRVENNFQNISRLERGDISPTLFWCYKLSGAFEIKLSEMIEELDFQAKNKLPKN
jgi:ribosome-binding protein aMBF1 (putative translation factor)